MIQIKVVYIFFDEHGTDATLGHRRPTHVDKPSGGPTLSRLCFKVNLTVLVIGFGLFSCGEACSSRFVDNKYSIRFCINVPLEMGH